MGKQSRRSKQTSSPKQCVSGTARIEMTKIVLSKLAEQQLTAGSIPQLKGLLQFLKDYERFGERSEISIDMTDVGCSLYVLLPKYVVEQPVIRLNPLS